MSAEMYLPDCSEFFKNYRIPIKDTPYPRVPRHLKPILDEAFELISILYDYSDGEFDKNKALITVDKPINAIIIELMDVNDRYMITYDEGEWQVYDETLFFQIFAEGEEEEQVYYPPQ